VIIDAIKESRRIFQRMNSYAIYRIAETLRVLLFMTAAILIFNFYPLTAVMIVMLALLNDGAILSIAYDNVHYKDKPEAWNMRMVLGVATVLGVIGPVAAFGLFYLGDRVFHLDHPHLQPMMYLMLSVAGHMTIFLTRTRGPFWSIRPAKILWMAVLGTQIVATLIAVYGLLMPPLGWRWAGFVWGYALIWALLSDRVKLLAYRIFDPVKTKSKAEAKAEDKPDVKADANAEAKDETKPEAKAEPKTETKAESTPETKAEPKPEAKEEPKPEAKTETPSDLTPQIAKRAYELYDERGHKDGRAVQDWEQAEREIRNPEAKAETKPETKAEPKPEAKAETKPEVKAEPKPEAKAETKPEAKAEPKPEAKAKTPSDLTPQLVKRVHELYEELGREDVRAVQDLEQAEREIRKPEAKAEPKPEESKPKKESQ
jgi:H+-transporting ATPase